MARPRKQPTEFAILDENDEPMDANDVREDMGVEKPVAPLVTHAGLNQAPKSSTPYVATQGPGRYFVKLTCPTPIMNQDGLEVEAVNEEDAREKFCQASGLSGSEHEWTITKVA